MGAQKKYTHIETGSYKSLVAISSKGEVIGNAIYTRINKRRIKLKNFRIDPDYRKRDLGHFLLSQMNYETKGAEIILDVTSDNFPAVEFFVRNGFHIVKKARLYLSNQDEFIMTRSHLR